MDSISSIIGEHILRSLNNTNSNLNHTILVVDDEYMSRCLLRLTLARAGFTVMEAIDSLDALDKLNRTCPDLVLLDVMMPQMDGYEVCRKLRNNDMTKKLPVVMLSAMTDIVSINRGIESGTTEYLKKPITAEELIYHVSRLLNISISSNSKTMEAMQTSWKTHHL